MSLANNQGGNMFRILAIAAMAMGLGFNKADAKLQPKGGLDQQIVGGEEAREKEFPFIVSLQKSSHFCGGSLIARDWVLTAAHCVQGSTKGIKIVIGLHSLKNTSQAETRSIAKVIVHPNYNAREYDFDYALVQLTENS